MSARHWRLSTSQEAECPNSPRHSKTCLPRRYIHLPVRDSTGWSGRVHCPGGSGYPNRKGKGLMLRKTGYVTIQLAHVDEVVCGNRTARVAGYTNIPIGTVLNSVGGSCGGRINRVGLGKPGQQEKSQTPN